MRYFFLAVMILLLLSVAFSCKGKGEEGELRITDRKIPVDDITDFYYTYENLNYNAFYQRYRFYSEAGKLYFYHETREVKDDYGPATEDDVTEKGILELTPEEWNEVFTLLRNGRVTERKESTETGDSGPWTFIYWKGDKDRFQEYSFGSVEERKAFEEKCRELAERL